MFLSPNLFTFSDEKPEVPTGEVSWPHYQRIILALKLNVIQKTLTLLFFVCACKGWENSQSTEGKNRMRGGGGALEALEDLSVDRTAATRGRAPGFAPLTPCHRALSGFCCALSPSRLKSVVKLWRSGLLFFFLTSCVLRKPQWNKS